MSFLVDWFTLSRIGLLYDLFGALILVWGYVFQGKKEFLEAISHYGPDEPLVAILTKLDSIMGLSLIVVGFLAQLLATIQSTSTAFSSCCTCIIFELIFLVSASVTYLVFRKVASRYYWRHLNKHISRPGSHNPKARS